MIFKSKLIDKKGCRYSNDKALKTSSQLNTGSLETGKPLIGILQLSYVRKVKNRTYKTAVKNL
ncbi:MAG: hypothetical protein ACI8SE_000854 [Bacteroidia bacterium]|jgi:hypothetical protein